MLHTQMNLQAFLKTPILEKIQQVSKIRCNKKISLLFFISLADSVVETPVISAFLVFELMVANICSIADEISSVVAACSFAF